MSPGVESGPRAALPTRPARLEPDCPAREGPEQVKAAVEQPSEGGEKVRARVSLRPRRPRAGLSECFQVNGADYRGHQNRTGPLGAGRPCLYWDQTQQHSYSSASDPQGRWGLGAHNFCR